MPTPPTSRTVNWLLVGAGDIANRRVGPALADAANSRLAAICDPDRVRAEALAARLKVGTVYTDLGEALARCQADAVYIATPLTTHLEVCLLCLKARRNILCEKPLALNGRDALEILHAARAAGVVTSCSNYRRLSGQYRLTESLLREGKLGRLFGGWAVYSTPFYNPGGHPITKAVGASRIKELGFYLIDIAHHLFGGMPVAVMAAGSVIDQARMGEVEDVATVVLRFAGGELFTIVFNSGSPGTRHELELFGERGRAYWRDWPPHGNGPVRLCDATGERCIEAPSAANVHLPMVQDFVDALREGRPPACSLESAARTEVITDAIFRSLESGRCEDVTWEDRP